MSDSHGNSLEPSRHNLSPIELALILVWAAAVMSLGGLGTGVAITKLAALGFALLWLLGEVAGVVGRKLVPQKSAVAGLILVVACIGAFVIAIVCWLHWKTVQGEESWLAAIRLLPTFMQEYTGDAVIGGILCFLGANSAYRRVARRYRIVHVVED